ncbi:MAG: AbrB/MazE/SpoVT family DNA-binding domain-containing protein [Candidatus Aenigmarchaeota archaeon]|nr:AbrB/MazE/SpoVT family DNA-binding domain-containing protein [Candidatus Aenigmarchaeota archaeon]
MDEKGRIQLPPALRKSWHLKPRQSLELEVQTEAAVLRKARKPDPKTDPVLRDIMLRPGKSRMKVTRALLRKLENEAWNP